MLGLITEMVTISRLKFAIGTTVGIYAYAADQTNKETIELSKKIRTVLDWTRYPPTTGELTHARTLATREVRAIPSVYRLVLNFPSRVPTSIS